MSRPIFWKDDVIKEGLDKLFTELQHSPTATEIDCCNYLPSYRQLLRRYGGVINLRSLCGYEITDLGSGPNRSMLAYSVNKKGRECELELETILVNKFGMPFVHTERRFGNKGNRIDFFVFTPDGNLGIDVFYVTHISDLQKSLNIKINNYTSFPDDIDLFFVCANREFSNEVIESTCKNMSKLKSKKRLILCSLNRFYEIIDKYRRYNWMGI